MLKIIPKHRYLLNRILNFGMYSTVYYIQLDGYFKIIILLEVSSIYIRLDALGYKYIVYKLT